MTTRPPVKYPAPVEPSIVTGRARWFRRTLRFWLLVLLPLAAYSAYSARESDRELPFWDHNRMDWTGRLRTIDDAGGASSLEAIDAREHIGTAFGAIREITARRDLLTQIALGLALFPVFAWIVSYSVVWIWRDEMESARVAVDLDPLRFPRRDP